MADLHQRLRVIASPLLKTTSLFEPSQLREGGYGCEPDNKTYDQIYSTEKQSELIPSVNLREVLGGSGFTMCFFKIFPNPCH